MLEHSTQYNNWCFVSKDNEIENIKSQKVTKYRKIYQKVLNKNPQAEIQLFGVEDENVILNFYVSQMSQLCQSFPLKVEASAITYFKRFFLKTTLLNHDPKKYIFTCVYLALKTEEIHIESFESLSRQYKDPFFSFYPELEQEVLKTINFDLKVYHAFTPALSLLERLKEDEKVKWDLEKFNKIYTDCIKITRICFFDFLIFEYSHGLIALSAFTIALKRNQIEIEDVSTLADIIAASATAQLKIEEIKIYVEKFEATNFKEEAIKALKKLKSYHQPKHKDEFVKPVEKHHHPNPHPNSEQVNLEKKP